MGARDWRNMAAAQPIAGWWTGRWALGAGAARGAAALFLCTLCCADAGADLRSDVELEITRAQLGTATVAISVRDAETSSVLVAVNDEAPLIPASNMKLLSSGAALHVLGPEFAFRTRLVRAGGRLVVAGDGDPGLGDPELLKETTVGGRSGPDIDEFLDAWAGSIAAAGIEAVDELVVDDRIFDRQFVHPGWPPDQLNRRYCAEVAGANVHLNALYLYPRPTAGERPDASVVRPRADWVEVVNRATCRTGPQDANTAWIARGPGSNLLTLHGNVRFAYRDDPVPVTFHDPPAFLAALLAERLGAAGVRVTANRAARQGDPVAAGDAVGPIVTTSITTALRRCNRDSQNLYAEALLKRMAAAVTNEPGSWATGAALVRHVVHQRLGGPALAMGLVVADGSGLSRDNRVTASALCAWLASFHTDARVGPILVASLAQPGEGTLENRFTATPLYGATLRAKSGYIRAVSCLSGYVTAPDGRRRAFSILINGLDEPGSVGRAKALQELVVSAIARDLAASAAPAVEVGMP
jgi:D-alanyl-D-alanine carboxypeptidase/D-alanyl-D-alanine-endopeptidase (penicillin-binding protein 4)